MATPRSKKKYFGLGASEAVSLAGVVAAMLLGLVLNVLGARHYKRWDWTTSQRYSLTPATLTTLHDLPDTVELWVMLGSQDPLAQSVKQLLVSYAAETTKLDVHWVDPDRDRVALEDVRRRFRIQAGVTEEGHVATDAIMVVARGEKHWFLGATDMVEVAEGDDPRAKPKEEQAITGAIRNVLGGEKARLCFTAGHGEMSLTDAGEQGLGQVKDILDKDNYEAVQIDTSEPNAHEPFKGCAVAIIAGARAPFSRDEEARLKTFLLEGGSALVALSPINAESETGMAPAGLAEAIAPFGIALEEALIVETDPQFALPKMHGDQFIVSPKMHPVTAALVHGEGAAPRDPPRVVVYHARPLRHVSPPGASSAVDLLATSPKSFAMSSLVGARDWADVPEKKEKDEAGPLIIAMASERPKLSPSLPHGPRLVVLGSSYALVDRNWREPTPVRGAAFFVESAISWLASKPQILDVPPRPSVAAGIRINEDARSEVRRYVLIFMPLAAALLGLAVGLRRRSTEGKPRKRSAP